MRLLCLLGAVILLAGCAPGAAPEPTPEPITLVTEAAGNIRAADTFRMTITQTGAPYLIDTGLGSVTFRRADAQYVSPGAMQARARLVAAGLSADVDIFSRGPDQWYRNAILTGGRWVNLPFAEGFNPEELIGQDSGFQAALSALIELQLVGQESLEDGTSVYHLTGLAQGEAITTLMVGLITATGTVNVDVYIDTETRFPARLVIVQPETVTESEPEPTTWTIDVYDVNAPSELENPDLLAQAEATAEPVGEATAEATSEITGEATQEAGG